MVFTRPPNFKSSNPFSNTLVTVPKAPITIGTIVTFMFYSLFFSIPYQGLSFFSLSFSFILWLVETVKYTQFFKFSFLLIIIIIIIIIPFTLASGLSLES